MQLLFSLSHYYSSSNTVFKPSPLIEFTLADVTHSQGFKATTYEDGKYPNNIPATPVSPGTGPGTALRSDSESFATKIETQNDNRRYSTLYTNGEQQFSFPNEQQQQQQQQHGFLPQQTRYHQDQQHEHFAQQLTEMPIYIYKDPYTNENYHYTPTEANNKDVLVTAASPSAYTHNNYNDHGYQQQQSQYQHAAPNAALQDNQEYLVHSSMLVGTQHASSPSVTSDRKDVYQKRPGLVYDESYVSHPNAVIEKNSEVGSAAKKTNKISYDSHDYPPPSYHQQQTSNFLPTPVPDKPATPKPTASPVRPPPSPNYYTSPTPAPARPPPNYYATPSAPTPNRPAFSYATPRPPPADDYRPRPSSPFSGGQQYLQSSQNALPNYANNLDNYLSNKQQTEYYRPEQPPVSYLQQNRETIPPPFRQQQQQQYQQSSYPPFGQQQSSSYPPYQTAPPPRPAYNNYYDYQIGEIPPQTQGASNYPYPRPPPSQNGPYRPPYVPPTTTQQPSGLATLVQYAPQFTSLLLGGGVGSSSNTNSPLGSLLLGALTGGATSPQGSSPGNRRPINSQLVKALENISRNDDLQCVPKVVCQMIAGQTQRGQLPSFITSPAITK